MNLLNDIISISVITPEVKLRTFLICRFVSKENTRKHMLIKRLMDFSMYNTLTAPSNVWETNENKIKIKVLSNIFLVIIVLFSGPRQYEFD